LFYICNRTGSQATLKLTIMIQRVKLHRLGYEEPEIVVYDNLNAMFIDLTQRDEEFSSIELDIHLTRSNELAETASHLVAMSKLLSDD